MTQRVNHCDSYRYMHGSPPELSSFQVLSLKEVIVQVSIVLSQEKGSYCFIAML